jgi:predicted aspartyl protease
MPTYDSTQFDPPAPVATVSLRAPNHDKVVDNVPMLIDTGADLTLIPERFVAELKAELGENHAYELEGFDGRKIMTRSVQLELVFLGRAFRGRFVLINSDRGILGRNVLNHFALLLDGPGLNWQRR